HAEMQAITAASQALGGKYLNDCTLYVTLEPCVMCAGALFWAQIGKVVYGASDPKRGYSRVGMNLLHPKTEVVGGVLAEQCAGLIKEFFQRKR
ncbi:MAG: nucleoside deaminase, partial [Bacteroidetes bacterium]|nr:nucleoside deaminase [Candidatus Pullibacteroides excrementavium]